MRAAATGSVGSMVTVLTVTLSLLAAPIAAQSKDYDRINNLPGLTFTPSFNQYSGYLNSSPGNHLFYWLVESQNKPSTDPLVLWLNGGPGCSSLGGFFTEHGPFHASEGGQYLVENVQSWNKLANVLYLEAPRGVGFSYRDKSAPADDIYNDDKTASDNALALVDFFNRFSEYKGRPFYITGESYGGVYVPTLTDLVIKLINNGTLGGVSLAGMAVGNGILSTTQQLNSAVDLLYYRGMLGVSQWDQLKQCCVDTNGQPLQYCDYSKYVYADDKGNFVPNTNLTDTNDIMCATLVISYAQQMVWETENDVYNSYQDCYNFSSNAASFQAKTRTHMRKSVRGTLATTKSKLDALASVPATPVQSANPFVDQGAKVNMNSTDALNRFQCYMDDATQTYLQRADVRAALHVVSDSAPWVDCNDDMNENLYVQQNHDMTPVFQSMINSGYKFNILIYNGDVDMACNFLGDEWFIENLVTLYNTTVLVSDRDSWLYTRPDGDFLTNPGGYVKSWNIGTNIQLDLLTVKGGGHFVPTDRPAPALQMLHNFIYSRNYNNTVHYSHTPAPLKPEFVLPPPNSWTRKQADRIWNLPGLTYNPTFRQYSGYLNATAGNSLHYWFVESQSNPTTDPLILWLNGGPGCSSLMGFLSELGPFHNNPDGQTLFENIYSWNKGANILFLEGPRNVGFSVQDTTINNDTTYNDDKTARDNMLALKDFFTVYPELVGRAFYVTGESYGGVYVPTLTSLLIDEIQAGRFPQLNLVGMAVGNGELSALQQINSAIHLLYFHGLYGKKEWDSLQQCCNSDTSDPKWFEYCDFSQYIDLDTAGNAHPKAGSGVCGDLVASMGQDRVWNSINDVYNIYQDCYQQTHVVFGSQFLNKHKEKFFEFAAAQQSFTDQASQISHFSTDAQGGYQCFASDAAADYLNSDDVRAALHVSDLAGNWSSCNDDINANYIQQHNDTGPVFDHIIQSGYPLRMLIYNGDVDMACNFIGDQWFVEAVAAKWNMPVTKARDQWRYMSQIAGYVKQWKLNQTTLEFLTVKGAGHLVPSDRPGPALQMITNFIRTQDYSNPIPYNTQFSVLNTQYQVAEQLAAAVKSNNGNAAVAADAKIQHPSEQKKQKSNDAHLRAKRASVVDAPPPPPPASKNSDRLSQDLPGITYNPGFLQYSGYLQASQGNYLHYWLVESQNDPANDPLILWLNGGPGCSSLGGLMEELGPFHANQDGQTLFENVFSWNKVGNVLFLEAPRGVGFSYQSNEFPFDNEYNDDKTALDNVLALRSFYYRFPEYKNRTFYIAGESYGGVYVPTLVNTLIDWIQNGTLNYINLQGAAIGNGELSAVQQINSAVSLLYFRGESGKSEWDQLSQCCQNDTSKPQTYCDFTSYINIDTAGNAWSKVNDNSLNGVCGNLVVQQGFNNVWMTDNDVYNTFIDCYVDNGEPANFNANMAQRRKQRAKSRQEGHRVKRDALPPLMNSQQFVDQAQTYNYGATDNGGGFTCWSGDSSQTYLRRQDVQDVLHIPRGVAPDWSDCNDDMNEHYVQQHNDTTSVFDEILSKNYPMRFLVYNGDADMACQFLGDEWFMENLAQKYNMIAGDRSPWNYTQQPEKNFGAQIGGYVNSYTYNQVKFDLLTVKGGGHFVPTDRPGPALSMINNFIKSRNYSTPLDINIDPKPLKPEYQAAPTTINRRKADMIFDLPGTTFVPNFNHHSGYLSGSQAGSFLHYWFIESTNQDDNVPLVLWLNGGPGCSSVGGLLTELGPFHPSPDGTTLFENVFSWHKAAHVLFLESPRGVGFSYQDPAKSNSTLYNDDLTAQDAYAALRDFMTVYPMFANAEFYVAGESYAGVYVPTLTRLLIQKIQDGSLTLNLQGMMVGNGMISPVQDIRSLPDFLYFHGVYGKSDWDNLRACCPQDSFDNSAVVSSCHYDYYVTMVSSGDLVAKTFNDSFSQNCADMVVQMAQDRMWNSGNDAYNLYQDCYAKTHFVFGTDAMPAMQDKVEEDRGRAFVHNRFFAQMTGTTPTGPIDSSQFDPLSTDSMGGFQCYMTDGATTYLGQKHVRNALHIPDFVQDWALCSDTVGNNYQMQYNDTTPVFQDILNSGYNLRMLIYNGDADMACSMFEAEWMIETFASSNQMIVKKDRSAWYYGGQIGGYSKNFQKDNLSIDLLTVKGAGHLVPTDRPGPALQMASNFLAKNPIYSDPIKWDLTRLPLRPQYVELGNGPVQQDDTSAAPSTTTTTKQPPLTVPPTSTSTKPPVTQPPQTTQTKTNPPSSTTTTTVPPPPPTTTSLTSTSTVSAVLMLVVAYLL